MLRFDSIDFTYCVSGGAAVRALCGVSLTVAPREEVAVLGANGSGKSTLARLANGILLADSGAVTVDGIDTRDESRVRELRRLTGIVFQHPDDQIVATSVEDEVAFGPENLGLPRDEIRQRVDEALSVVGLSGLERREPHLLSGGQKQRLAIAGALAMRPAYLVLDEPTSMLDSRGREDVLKLIASLRSAGHGILHITHDLADVAHADRMVVLDRGEVVFTGAPAALFDCGDLVDASGLVLPPITVLTQELRALGADLSPMAVDPDSIVEALWR